MVNIKKTRKARIVEDTSTVESIITYDADVGSQKL